ncbi:UDP-N-acetylmuramate dehydrogenase [Sinomicrobium sp. FJxs]|uniref:UDP-N-acetylenolpyruvoylglucosamine reductase n=1 Tax=Sinomicrobium weinanense TaxID=2842200 RepID=A0A926JRS6_9FLAO|nr:UDP-N-acetylmuramate dehydrogenase [Sinomicrobium weinanense]MBC9796092.1 UDP-N-acetylmuramate dehydrogenase [Sinomicrobium weinanense]MBU3124761.1 UDP-N-acetylmuramate dehydrogenase [Sinomicrobium weinanense]
MKRLNIQHDISLKKHNTFGIDVKARHFTSVSATEELRDILRQPGYPDKFILGGGSNILFTGDVEALVIHMNIKGITVTQEGEDHVFIRAGAGENWHEFVLWTLEKGYGGLENLSLIPGNVGTAPIQNIGAYGVELKDVFSSCEAVEIASGETKSFHLQDCRFGYRNSIFKQEAKGKYIITSVTFKLTKRKHHIHIDYGAIRSRLAEQGIETPSIRDISEAVISIRRSKLPDPAEIGNSGSFFKNPVIPAEDFEKLKNRYPEIPHYPVSEKHVKVPAGWLIEQCGFKGRRFGDAGVHTKQALVLVNYGNATGKEIWKLAQDIRETVSEKFGISIHPEVNVL